MTQTTVSPARRAETAAQLRRGRILRAVRSVLRHLLLALLAAIWLVPILWLLVTSFSTDRGINVRQFFPASYTLRNYVNILFHPDSVAQFPRWFTNTLVVACFNCVISTCFVLMVAYALSCCRFKGRKLIQDLSVSVNLFPGVLAMIAVYFVLKYLNLTNSYAGLIMVYTDPLTGEMKKKQMKFFPDAYKNRIGKSYNDYIADHQMNMFEDFIGYQSSTVLDEPKREAGTTSIPIPQREESENIPLPDLPGQLENVQQSGNEIAKRGMPT